MRLTVEHVRAPMRCAMEAAWGTTSARELLLVGLTDGDGRHGYGEAAPLPGYDPVTLGDVLEALEDCRDVLEAAAGGENHAELVAHCAQRTVIPQALSAIDLALWDLDGRRCAD